MISTAVGDTLSEPHCWKYVNCVTSMPSSHTSQPSPQAPSTGLSQLSSTNRRSCARVSMPSASSDPRYSSCAFPGSGFRITWNCVCRCTRFGLSP